MALDQRPRGRTGARRRYWKAGTDVDGRRRRQQRARRATGSTARRTATSTFHVGDAHIYKVNTQTHQMKVFSNGKLLRTIPITTGEQPEFTTRSGDQGDHREVRHKRMNSETVGIAADSADGYDIDDVQYAMRVTYSGEFVHAAPWSVGSQGYANVSHGCTGMSTDNAGWLYAMTKPRRRRRVHRHRPPDDPRPTATATGTSPSPTYSSGLRSLLTARDPARKFRASRRFPQAARDGCDAMSGAGKPAGRVDT